MEEIFVTTNGVRLRVVQSGPASGAPVMLLHGFPEFSYGWRHQLDSLTTAGFRVFAPDQRGYNLSDKPKHVGAYGVGVLAADIVGLLDALNIEKVGLVGHDWGGVVAWHVAASYPERVHRLAVLNAPAAGVMMRALWHRPSQLLKSWYVVMFQLPWLPEFFARRGNWALVVRSLRGSSRRGTFSDQDLDEYRRAWSQPNAFTSMVNWYRAALRSSSEGRGGSRRIAMPTLIIWGDRDAFLGKELADESIARCDDGRVVHLENATHWVQHEEPQRVNELLIQFFRGA